jgi:predicted kinase
MSIEGSADREAFLLYIEHFLRPTLKRGQIVVIDNNLQVHKKMRRVRELIEGHGCSLVFLPSYSPDFNQPSRRSKGSREGQSETFKALVETPDWALSAVMQEDARGFFRHCGYGTPWEFWL